MKPNEIILKLGSNRSILKGILENKTREEIIWKHKPEHWCPLEIVCHLIDEEREDFRARTRAALEEPGSLLKPIRPQEWISERKYMLQDYQSKVKEFLEERDQSIQWLESLANVNWDQTARHDQLGPSSARHFLTNWLAHDYLHIKQLLRNQYDYLREKSGNDLKYAGKWT